MSMPDPPDLIGRSLEWDALSRFAASDGRLAIVYGRRLLGKTHLTSRLASAHGGLYFCAGQLTSRENLEELSAAVSLWRGRPVVYRTWTDAFDDLLNGDDNSVVVLDEIGYATDAEPSIPSLIQRNVDRRRRGGSRLVLCGSTIQAVRALAAPGAPLRGRARLEMVLEPFDYRTASTFWGIRNPAVAALVWAVVGGVAGYRELCNDETPRSTGDIGSWVTKHVLDPTSPLHREGRTVLLEEPTVSDRASHWQALAAIAAGARTRAAIATAINRPSTALGPTLDVLCATGLVSRTDDALHGRGAYYEITEPILRTWKYLAEPVQRRAPLGRRDRLFADLEAAFYSHVVGPAFEQLGRDWVARFASEQTIGGRPTIVAPAMIGRRQVEGDQNQIDLVAVERDAGGHRNVLAIGEAKHRTRPMTIEDLDRLRQLRMRVKAPNAKLLMISAAGFDRAVVREAKRTTEIELCDLDRLYFDS
jgi:uncharacterized protein